MQVPRLTLAHVLERGRHLKSFARCRHARGFGEARVTSAPPNMIVPAVGMVSPARQLKKVDLPAPLGPISPMISPSSTAKSAPATARNSPNIFETFLASSSMGGLSQIRRHAVPQIDQAARLEARDQDD